MNNKDTNIGLYDHNIKSYNKIKEAFNSGENKVAIVHATGTGKSYNALQYSYDNKDKKIIYIVPSNSIIEHLKQIIDENPNINKSDFNHVEFRTYQSFITLSKKEIEKLNCDVLILDEFQHIGAPIWGAVINIIIETHPNIKVLGMTAYTVRNRGKIYQRDMVNPLKDEIFSGKVVSQYDLVDAMIDGVLPKPIYKTAYTNLMGLASMLEEKVLSRKSSVKEKQEYMKILSDVKRTIHKSSSIYDIVKRNLKKNGKYIYFCPPFSEHGVNDINTIIKQAKQWFYDMGLKDDDFVIYRSTSDMKDHGKKNREAFYNDEDLDGNKKSDKLRIMFAINQYNEGVHAPNVDGVIIGRGTSSDIVFYEQLGRALAVRGKTCEHFQEYQNYSISELRKLCEERNIKINLEASKEELIQMLLAPVIIDLANNYEFIKQLEDNLKDRIKQIQRQGTSHRKIKISDASFDIQIDNVDLYEMLSYLKDRLYNTWMEKYNLAKIYYEHNGHLKMSKNFKTINGYEYDENGIKLYQWLEMQRQVYRGNRFNKITEKQIELLKKIGMRFENIDLMDTWMEKYNLAKIYYEHNGNLEVPVTFKTTNGYEDDENGIKLGQWIVNQRQAYKGNVFNKITEKQIELLKKIGMRFENIDLMDAWMEKYNLVKNYYEHYGHIKIPPDFKTINGYEPNEKGIKLYQWLVNQRQAYIGKVTLQLTEERIMLLSKLGMPWMQKSTDKKLQEEEINEKNSKRKQKEILNRTRTYLQHFDQASLPNKEELNNTFMEQLNYKSSKK